MATIIDSLLVTLGLDRSEFKKGVKEVESIQKGMKNQANKDAKERQEIDKKTGEAQTKNAKNLQEASKKSAESIRQIRNQAIGLLALFTGGIGLARFASDTITTAANVGRLSANIGESIQTIVGWQRAFENVGGTADEATASLTKASNAIGAFKSGRASPEIQGFLQMGGSIDNGELDSANSFLLAQSALIQRIIKERGAAVAMYQAQSFLGVGANEFNLLRQGPQAVSGQVGSLGASSGMNTKSAEAAAALQVKLNKLKNTFGDVSRIVLLSLIPVFDRLLGYFQKMASWIQSHQGDIVRFVDVAVKEITKLAGVVNEIAEKLGGWGNVFEGLVAIKFASFIGDLGSVLRLVTGIASAAGLASTAIAAIAGYKLGEWINKNFVEGTEFGDFLGKKMTELSAIMGSKEAQEGLRRLHELSLAQSASEQSGNMMSADFNGSQQSDPVRRSASAAAGNMMSTETNIENVNIVTQAKDSDGIARTIKPALESRLAPQANSGVF